MEHIHDWDDATGEPSVCPVNGCYFNGIPLEAAEAELGQREPVA